MPSDPEHVRKPAEANCKALAAYLKLVEEVVEQLGMQDWGIHFPSLGPAPAAPPPALDATSAVASARAAPAASPSLDGSDGMEDLIMFFIFTPDCMRSVARELGAVRPAPGHGRDLGALIRSPAWHLQRRLRDAARGGGGARRGGIASLVQRLEALYRQLGVHPGRS